MYKRQEQKLGHVFRIESRVHGSRGIPGDWRKEKVHGGGMVLDWGVHLLDQICLLYTSLQQMRYDFIIEMNIEDGSYLDQPTVRMLFQPLVENAIR